MVVLTMGLIVAVGLLGITFNTFLFQCTRSQYEVDALGVTLASSMNAGDRIGQMNELLESSRELIHLSDRQVVDCHAKDLEILAPLCQQFAVEAHQGH